MTQTTAKWLKSPEVRKLKKCNMNTLLTEKFFRDPMRRLYYNKKVFLSPADGTVLYAHENIGPTEKIVEIKGKKFTVQDILNDKSYTDRSLVIGIFMSIMDVHINRMPTNGYVSETAETPFIFTHNASMLELEQGLFYQTKFNPNNMEYLFQNERLISTIYYPEIEDEYFLVQIADKDVNCIVNWAEGDYLMQGERIGMIRWGSQVDLIIPLDDKADTPPYQILVKPFDHVKAGMDKLVRILG